MMMPILRIVPSSGFFLLNLVHGLIYEAVYIRASLVPGYKIRSFQLHANSEKVEE